jgi:8-oxo-dGTP pyrophosphatase MutT (NUDIX family)
MIPDIKCVWLRKALPPSLHVKQVYGIIFDNFGRIFLQDDQSRFNLPGGKPDGNETFAQTLMRECLEESWVTVRNYCYLGFIHVEEYEAEQLISTYAQVRLIAKLDQILSVQPDPATGRTYKRLFAPLKDAIYLLNWGDHGKDQLTDAFYKANSTWEFSGIKQFVEYLN